MFLRIDKLQVELPQPKEQNPNAAAAVQELLGGRFGEMSTLMNYMYQSFNFRNKKALKPYYDLIANIAAEELGHIELVSATVNALLAGPDITESEKPVDPSKAPLQDYQVGQACWCRTRGAFPGRGITCSRAATSCSTYCTTFFSRAEPETTNSASTK
jgi:Mn-containing catalase